MSINFIEEDGNLIRFGEFDDKKFRDAKNCLLKGVRIVKSSFMLISEVFSKVTRSYACDQSYIN